MPKLPWLPRKFLSLTLLASLSTSRAQVPPSAPVAGPSTTAPATTRPGVPYQTLTDVKELNVGADGRLWTSTSSRTNIPSRESVRAELAAQFDQPRRKFSFVPRLIEPNGRIWVFAASRTIALPDPATSRTIPGPAPSAYYLIAFDGKDFIEHKISSFVISVNSPDIIPVGPPAAFYDGSAFFALNNVIHRFDGKSWSEQTLPHSPMSPVALLSDRDGTELVAVGLDTGDNWLFRKDKWSRIGAEPFPSEGSYFTSASIFASGLWVASRTNFAVYTLGTLPDFDAGLIQRLRSNDPTVRQDANKLLLARRYLALPAIEAELAKGGSDDVTSILKTLREQIRWLPPLITHYWAFGNFEIRNAQLCLPLPDGGAILVGSIADLMLRPPPAAPPAVPTSDNVMARVNASVVPARLAMIRIAPDLSATLVGNADFVEKLFSGPVDTRAGGILSARVVEHGNAVWFMNSAAPHPTLLDLTTGKIRTTITGPAGELIAATDDGILYFREKLARGEQITSWNTKVADTRTLLNVHNPGTAFDRLPAQSADGALWVLPALSNTSVPVAKFNGGALQNLPYTLDLPTGAKILPGANALLVRARTGWTLATADKAFTSLTLDELIAENYATFVAAWKLSKPDGQSHGNIQIDSRGNTWQIDEDGQSLAVFDSKRWILPEDPAATGKRIANMFLIGDGSQVYVGTPGYFATLVGGHIKLFPAPPITVSNNSNALANSPVLAEPDGSLWISSGGTSTKEGNALHIRPAGTLATIEGVTPRARDSKGRIWVSQIQSDKSRSLQLYQEQKSLNVPALQDIHPTGQVFPLSDGNVIVATDEGLVEFVASNAPNSPAFTRGKTYLPGPHWTRDSSLLYSPQLNTFATFNKSSSEPPEFFKLP